MHLTLLMLIDTTRLHLHAELQRSDDDTAVGRETGGGIGVARDDRECEEGLPGDGTRSVDFVSRDPAARVESKQVDRRSDGRVQNRRIRRDNLRVDEGQVRRAASVLERQPGSVHLLRVCESNMRRPSDEYGSVGAEQHIHNGWRLHFER